MAELRDVLWLSKADAGLEPVGGPTGSLDSRAAGNRAGDRDRDRPLEKMVIPEFDGEASSEKDLRQEARSYLRRVQVWLRCTRLPPHHTRLACTRPCKAEPGSVRRNWMLMSWEAVKVPPTSWNGCERGSCSSRWQRLGT